MTCYTRALPGRRNCSSTRAFRTSRWSTRLFPASPSVQPSSSAGMGCAARCSRSRCALLFLSRRVDTGPFSPAVLRGEGRARPGSAGQNTPGYAQYMKQSANCSEETLTSMNTTLTGARDSETDSAGCEIAIREMVGRDPARSGNRGSHRYRSAPPPRTLSTHIAAHHRTCANTLPRCHLMCMLCACADCLCAASAGQPRTSGCRCGRCFNTLFHSHNLPRPAAHLCAEPDHHVHR